MRNPMKYWEEEMAKKQMQTAEIENQLAIQNLNQAQPIEQHNDVGIIKEQLDLGEELQRIDYLLRSYTIKINPETGESKWEKPDDEDLIILSDYGVNVIRSMIAWYLNKNTLLSNYEEETINKKMRRFATTLNDKIFREYEYIFAYPSLERIKEELRQKVLRKANIKAFAYEILGKKVDEKDLVNEVLEEFKDGIEREMMRIRDNIIRKKLSNFELIIREVQDAVHSAYLRAFGGQERRSLRQHMQVTETKGGYQLPMQDTSKTRGFGSLFKR